MAGRIPHIQPDNLGRAKIGNQLRLVPFDLSLARTPAENVLAGTRHYLDYRLGLLAAADQMAFLDGPRDATGGPDGPPGVWLLVPSDAQESRPMVDGAPVPVSPPRKWAGIPSAWLAARCSAAPRKPVVALAA